MLVVAYQHLEADSNKITWKICSEGMKYHSMELCLPTTCLISNSQCGKKLQCFLRYDVWVYIIQSRLHLQALYFCIYNSTKENLRVFKRVEQTFIYFTQKTISIILYQIHSSDNQNQSNHHLATAKHKKAVLFINAFSFIHTSIIFSSFYHTQETNFPSFFFLYFSLYFHSIQSQTSILKLTLLTSSFYL